LEPAHGETSECLLQPPTGDNVRSLVPQCLQPQRGVDGGPQRALFLVGDSHTALSVEGLRRAVAGEFIVVWSAVGYGCTYDFNGGKGDRTDPGDSLYCRSFALKVSQVLRDSILPGDVVMLRSSGINFRARTVEWIRSILAPSVTSRGASLVIAGDNPRLIQRGDLCIPTPFNANALARCDSSLRDADPSRLSDEGAGVSHALRSLAERTDGVYFFDLFGLFCEPRRCRAVIPGTTAYWLFDQDHFTATGDNYLWPFWCSFFKQHGWFRAKVGAHFEPAFVPWDLSDNHDDDDD